MKTPPGRRSRRTSAETLRQARAELEERTTALQAAAQEARLRMAAIVESSDDAIIGKTLEGLITSWNRGAERIYGYSADEVIGRPISILIPPEQPDELPGIMERLKRGERIEHYDTIRVRRDGNRVNISLTVSPIRGADGQLIGASAVARDVTERMDGEQERLRLIAQLQEADQLKNRFLAMLAHELRNPLAPIRNSLHVLRLPTATTAHHEAARDVIERQVQHLARLIDDLLDVSRIVQDRIELRRERASLRTILERAVETAQPTITARRHTLSVAVPSDTIALDVDVVRISQAISNVLLNAAKYTDPGGQIAITAERGNGTIAIRIKDSGIGIDAAFMPRIFDLFSQAEASLDRSQGGLGIGLTLVRKLVELHGGSVQAYSPGPGQGSEFVITLPALSTEPVAMEPRRRDPTRLRPGRKVLVVDDNVDTAESAATLLRLAGHEVCTAHDGMAAIERLRTFHPDVMLLDIGLPGLNGYEIARRVRATPGYGSVVLVAITGYGQRHDKQLSQEAGFDHHLTKPLDPEVLESLVEAPSSFSPERAP